MKGFSFMKKALWVIALAVLAGPGWGSPFAVDGASFYVTGYDVGSYYDEDKRVSVACYWKDGVRVELDGKSANSIAVNGGSVYVAGSYDKGACYWKDGVRVDLPLPAASEKAYFKDIAVDIAVSGGSVYVAGTYSNNTNTIVCYWKDGVRVDVDSTSKYDDSVTVADSIAVDGRTVFVAGTYKSHSCYWKDGKRVDLPVEGKSEAVGISVSGGSVYVTGFCFGGDGVYGPYLIKDGKKTNLPLPTGLFQGRTFGIMVAGGSVYITGMGFDPAPVTKCYWKDGKLVDFDIFVAAAKSSVAAESSVDAKTITMRVTLDPA
jgi:hypothetical protein